MAKFNLNLSETTYDDVSEIAERMDVSMADVLREAYKLLRWLTREMAAGNRLLIQRGERPPVELLLPMLEPLREAQAGETPSEPPGTT